MERKGRNHMEDPQVTLVNDNCFDFLAGLDDDSIDLICIDPPYEVSRETGFANGKPTGRSADRFRVSMDFGSWDAEGFVELGEAIRECHRILRKGGTLVCFYDLWKITTLRDYFEEAGFRQLRLIEWIKTNPVPLNSKTNYLTNAREIAVCGVKGGKPTFNSEYDNGVYSFPICHDRGRFHPTQKPLALIEAIIEKHSNPGDLVVDCFCGSGTCAVAAARTGRRFAGCEISPEYWEKGIRRLEAEGIRPSTRL